MWVSEGGREAKQGLILVFFVVDAPSSDPSLSSPWECVFVCCRTSVLICPSECLQLLCRCSLMHCCCCCCCCCRVLARQRPWWRWRWWWWLRAWIHLNGLGDTIFPFVQSLALILPIHLNGALTETNINFLIFPCVVFVFPPFATLPPESEALSRPGCS